MTECGKGHQNYLVLCCLLGETQKSCRKVKSLPYCLAMGGGPISPLCVSKMFLLPYNFWQRCRSFQVWISSYTWNCFELCMNIHIFLTFFFLCIFFRTFFPRIFSAGKAMCKQEHLWNLDGQMDWICHLYCLVFQNGRDGIFQDAEFLEASI